MNQLRWILLAVAITSSAQATDKPREPRVLFFTAPWCKYCAPALDGNGGLRSHFAASGWLIGDSVRDHIQIVDVDKRTDLRDLYEVEQLPAVVYIDGGRVAKAIPYKDVNTIVDLLNPDVAASPTPIAEVGRVIALLPRPQVGFVDWGCGDARWCIAAAEKWGCKVTGVEIDPTRAMIARRRVQESGLSHLVTIIEGDATTTDVVADVGVAYLYPQTLVKLKPRIERLKAFASYQHDPGGGAVRNGDTWIVTRAATAQAVAVWNGVAYSGPVCSNPNCGMCQSIRGQLARASVAAPETTTAESPRGHYETRKFCNGRSCWFAQVWVPD